MSQKLKSIDAVPGGTCATKLQPCACVGVLLVDDDEDLRQILRPVIEDAGHRCVQAGTLAEAKQFLSQGSCQLLVIDANLPDGSGVPTAVQAAHEGTKVIIISGDAGEMSRMQRDGIMYLRKPFRAADLAVLIQRLVRRADPPRG